jgi:hypothetical protein
MTLVRNLILGLAILWIVWQIFGCWRKIRTGGIIVPPLMAGTFVFALSLSIVLFVGASPFHLLWIFPLSYLLGIVLLFFPLTAKIMMGCLTVLAKLAIAHEQQTQGDRKSNKGKRKQFKPRTVKSKAS